MIRGEREKREGQSLPPYLHEYRSRVQTWQTRIKRNSQGDLLVEKGALVKLTKEGLPNAPFSGHAVVSFLTNEHHKDPQHFQQTVSEAEAKRLFGKLRERGLANYFAPLPLDTYHMTVMEGGLDNEYEPGLSTEHISEATSNAFSQIKQEELQTPKFKLLPPSIAGGMVLIHVAEPADEASWKSMQRIEQIMYDHLDPLGIVPRAPGESVWHVTLGYLRKPIIPKNDFATIESILQDHAVDYPNIIFPMEEIHLRRFLTMSDWGEAPVGKILQMSQA